MIDASKRLDPLCGGNTLHFRAEAQVALGQFDEAAATLTERLKHNPNSETSRSMRTRTLKKKSAVARLNCTRIAAGRTGTTSRTGFAPKPRSSALTYEPAQPNSHASVYAKGPGAHSEAFPFGQNRDIPETFLLRAAGA